MSTVLSLITAHWGIASGVGGLLATAVPFLGNIASAGTLTYIKLGFYALVAVAIAGGTWYVTKDVYQGQIAKLQAQYASEAAAADKAALVKLQAHDKAADLALEQAQQDQDQRNQTIVELRKEIANAPKTTACSTSPAIRSLLNGLRQPTANH